MTNRDTSDTACTAANCRSATRLAGRYPCPRHPAYTDGANPPSAAIVRDVALTWKRGAASAAYGSWPRPSMRTVTCATAAPM
jgi:hypothetical protein